MTEDAESSLVMPFIVCGPDGYDDGSFVAGWLCGVIDTKLQALDGTYGEIKFWADPRTIPQLDLIAMKYGLHLTHEPWEEHPDEWSECRIGPPIEETDG